ncbi:MAG TPA: tail fiber protein [Bryobacteraceae bacterium]|jgi:microcystin-dependent protein
MAEPFLGELRIFAFNFAPKGYALCNGQTLSIAQNQALFALLGTTYGGNGQTTFALPNLQSRLPVAWGQGQGLSPYTLGQTGGSPSVTVTTTQLPPHTHVMSAAASADNDAAQGNAPGKPGSTLQIYADPDGSALNSGAIPLAGSNQPHSNLQPSLCVTVCIALVGVFPSRN